MIKPTLDAGKRLEDHPLVAGHLRQLRFAEDRFSASATENMQASRGGGNAEFRSPGNPACSERKPEGLSTTQAARLMEVSARTVRNLIYRGQLESWRIRGGVLRVDTGSVTEWLEQRRKENDESRAA